jgi:hypothetical protein
MFCNRKRCGGLTEKHSESAGYWLAVFFSSLHIKASGFSSPLSPLVFIRKKLNFCGKVFLFKNKKLSKFEIFYVVGINIIKILIFTENTHFLIIIFLLLQFSIFVYNISV